MAEQAPPPTYSPDGRWWWDGRHWLPVTQAAPNAATQIPGTKTARRWPRICLATGIIAAAIGAFLVLGNTQNHHDCQSLLVSVIAHRACAGIDARYDGGVMALVAGAVVVVCAVVGIATDPMRRT
jgi:hypothetical protein